jgi:hypothetical protein
MELCYSSRLIEMLLNGFLQTAYSSAIILISCSQFTLS